MEDKKNIINNLTQKDEIKAQKSAQILMDSADISLFEILIEKMQYLFPFVKNNVLKRLQNAINKNNFKNLINFFEKYSSEFDDFFATSLAKYANEDITDEIFELFDTGTQEQKAYCAKYFFYIQDTIAIELLLKNLNCEFEPLACNCAQTLGALKEKTSYEQNLKILKDNSKDDFEKIKAVKFLVAYNNKEAVEPILEVMKSSSMAENIAAEIPYLESLLTLVKKENNIDSLICVDNIISGLAEIIPLDTLEYYELYEIFEYFISQKPSSKYSQILLNAYKKFELLSTNDEYNFDVDKNTKQSINKIYSLLKNQSDTFWNVQKDLVIDELFEDNYTRIIPALEIIKEYKLVSAIEQVKELLKSDNEIIKIQAVSTLRDFNEIKELDKSSLTFENPTLQAVYESYF